MKEKILYVDDEDINLELFKINFENHFEVLTAESGKDALKILKENNDIGVIYSDLKMPVMNGFELISQIKKQSPEKICIMLTAFADTDVMMKAINDELIFRYLLKPWKTDEIIKTTQLAIEKYKNGESQ